MSYVVIDLSFLGHDIWRIAAVGNDIVDACHLRNVLTHEVNHVIHRFDTI